MKVILTEELSGHRKLGEIVDVAGGFARNFLFPKGFAIIANSKNSKQAERIKKEAEKKEAAKKKEKDQLAEMLSNFTVTISKKVGEENRIFGNVTSIEIKEYLAKQNIEIDKREIELPEHGIKSLGEHFAKVNLGQGLFANLKILVIKELES
ncbi:50S ribosomal protein L9 [bacterium]|nr:50S ribosomal protein L9 [bacterium]MBU1598777.1 50S ribosomal protein L9 [bacterium]